MSTFVLIDAGGGNFSVPLRLENDDSGQGTQFRVQNDGETIVSAGGVDFTLAANQVNITGRFSTGKDPATLPPFSKAFMFVNEAIKYVCLFENARASDPRGLRIDFSGQTDGGTNDATESYIFAVNGIAQTRFFFSSDGGLHNFQSNDQDLSDEDLKIIEDDPVESMWAAAKALKIINYHHKWDPDGRMLIGLGAQQVKTVLPDCVKEKHMHHTPAVPAHNEKNSQGKTVRIAKTPEENIEIPMQYFTKDVAFCFYKAVQECMDRIEALEA